MNSSKWKVEMGPSPPNLTPTQVSNKVKTYPKVTESGVQRIDNYGSGIVGRK